MALERSTYAFSFHGDYSRPGTSASGSAAWGGMLAILHRWHDCARPGHYLITFNWKGWGDNVQCVVDDFGNLVPVASGGHSVHSIVAS